MKKINTGSSDFSDLRKENVIYVDKTAYMYRLATDEENKVVFMSRPRRFGKSLTVSAFKALFEGRRELFKGLEIERLGWKWQSYPVIHFEFNDLRATSVEDFEEDFVAYVKGRLTDAGYKYDESKSYSLNFGSAIESLAGKSRADHKDDPDRKGEGVVILIDEYDAPVGHALDEGRGDTRPFVRSLCPDEEPRWLYPLPVHDRHIEVHEALRVLGAEQHPRHVSEPRIRHDVRLHGG